jgi:thiamine transport system permease protein
MLSIILAASRMVGQVQVITNWQRIIGIIGFTLYQALLSTLLTLLVGLPAAFLFGLYNFRGKGLLRLLSTLPFILPTVVVAAGFNSLIGPRGWLNLLLMNLFQLGEPPVQLLNTLSAILLAHVFYNTAVIIRVVGSALEHLDPRLEQTSRTLGASPWRNFWNVTLPLLRPALASAILLVFLFDFTSFGVVILLGGPQFATLEVEIYYQTMQLLNLPLASILSMVQIVFTLVITLSILRFGGGEVIPVRPRVQVESLRKPIHLGERLFLIFMMVLLFVIFIAPLMGLMLRSITRMDAERGERGIVLSNITLDYYRELFINRRQSLFYVPPILALRNSLLYALASSLLSLIFGGMAATALTQKIRGNKLLDLMLMLPMGASAVTLGLGYVLAYGFNFQSRQLFPYLIPVVHSLVALPFVVRTLQPVMASIPITIKSAAATLGASRWHVWYRIEIPLVSRSVAVAGLFAFAISLGEFGATAFLTRPDIPTLPIAIYRFLGLPGALNYGQALAMATILLALCAAVMALIDLIQTRIYTGENS